MSNLGYLIEMAGEDATLVRTGGNVSTKAYIESVGRIAAGRRRLEPEYQYETGFLFPPDSGVVLGDLALIGGAYYLVMSLASVSAHGVTEGLRGMLYKCNSVASIYLYDSTSRRHDKLHKQNVQCLITQVRAQEWDADMTRVVREFRGRQQPFQVFAQADCGLDAGRREDAIIVDQDGNRYRVKQEFDMFIADGVLQAEVLLEK